MEGIYMLLMNLEIAEQIGYGERILLVGFTH